jgi:hypothetical protein
MFGLAWHALKYFRHWLPLLFLVCNRSGQGLHRRKVAFMIWFLMRRGGFKSIYSDASPKVWSQSASCEH